MSSLRICESVKHSRGADWRIQLCCLTGFKVMGVFIKFVQNFLFRKNVNIFVKSYLKKNIFFLFIKRCMYILKKYLCMNENFIFYTKIKFLNINKTCIFYKSCNKTADDVSVFFAQCVFLCLLAIMISSEIFWNQLTCHNLRGSKSIGFSLFCSFFGTSP